MDGTEAHVNFDAPAVLRKWPSLYNERRTGTAPYLLIDGTLDECMRFFSWSNQPRCATCTKFILRRSLHW
jgi:hypothetical protein